MQKLAAAIRRACSARAWSQGVELHRRDAVSQESADDDEIVLRVKAPNRPVALTIVLYLEDGEWDCDCGSRERACAHVAAAAIALTQADKAGEALQTAADSGGRVGYRFRRAGGALELERVIVGADDGETPVPTTLSAMMSSGASVQPEQADLSLDMLLGTRTRGRLGGDRLATMLPLLADVRDITLDGQTIRASAQPLLPRATVRDRGREVELRIDAAREITEVLVVGVALCGDTLRPLGETELTGEKLERLPIVRRFPAESLGELVTVLLPDLQRKLDVHVDSARLPRTSRTLRPRLAFEVEQDGDRVTAMATLVYGDPPCARIDGGRLVHLGGDVPLRDEVEEQRLAHRLRDELDMVLGRRVSHEGADAISFANRLQAFDGAAVGGLRRERPLEPRVVLDGDRFAVHFETRNESGKTREADPHQVIRAWQRGQALVPLLGGGWAPLPVDWLARHGPRIADLLAARDDKGRVAPFALTDLARLCEDLERPPPPGLAKLRPLIDGFTSLPAAELPADLRATLRGYQRRGVDWLSFLRDAGMGAVLADDMGLGKTLQALCAARGKTLVACPRSVIHNWADEIAKFRPGLRVCIYHGPRRSLEAAADVVLTTYAIVRMDQDALAAITWDTLILDEAQAIKNPDSQLARAAYALPGRFRLALSGTPVENRLDELWSQLHFTNRGLLGGRKDFDTRYARPIAAGDAGAAAALRGRIAPFVLRRLKREVAPELPPRTDMVLHVELDEAERAAYDSVRLATRSDVLEKLAAGGSVLAALEALLRLRQAACHTGLLPGQDAERSSKVEALCEALEDAAADGHKALVFSQWTSLLDRIEPELRARGIDFVRLDGSTSDRAGVVARFQADDGPPVMIISLKAGGTGLNLTAADHVFLCDPWWNPAVEDQAADRAHRIGQDRPVMVYRLVSIDTVEERILALQDKKRALADAALGQADAAQALTRDDLLALLE